MIRGNYLLVMADHIFSDGFLPALAAYGVAEDGVTLAVDRRMDSPLIDPDDATYVRCDAHGAITHIGKHLDAPDAVDCGAFLATPALAGAIAEAIAAGRPGSLSDGMQRLADQRRAFTHDVGDAWWLDVDDPRALALAQAEAGDWLQNAYRDEVSRAKTSELT
jgi:choline kinase